MKTLKPKVAVGWESTNLSSGVSPRFISRWPSAWWGPDECFQSKNPRRTCGFVQFSWASGADAVQGVVRQVCGPASGASTASRRHGFSCSFSLVSSRCAQCCFTKTVSSLPCPWSTLMLPSFPLSSPSPPTLLVSLCFHITYI